MRTAYGPAKIVHSARQIVQALWRGALAGHCMDYRYYEVLEETLRAFDYRYLILRNDGTGAVAIQPFFFVDQDITAGLPARFRSLIGKVRKRFPRFLNMRIAMVGCAAGEGRLDCAEPWAIDAMREAMGVYARRAKASIILFKDFPSGYRENLAPLTRAGYTRVPSMPAAHLDLDFASFDDYMQHKLSRIYRKGLRRKFRDSERLGELTMEVMTDVTPHVDEIFPLYLQTFQRSEFKFEELTKEYFCQLGRRMPERVRYFLWRHNGRIVAFNVCMIHEGVLHDLNVGMDYSIALDLHLYFITWRDVVSWAIGAKIRRYHTGPLNYDPKLHLRLSLSPQDLYARHLSPLMNPIFGLAMKFLEPTRHDKTLGKFANAHEL